jgi:putative membrane protein
VLIAGLSVAAGAGLAMPWLRLGSLSSHMAVHIAAMNVAAPLLAVLYGWRRPHGHVGAGRLWAAASCQIGVLWAWHLPSAHHVVAASATGSVVTHAGLLAAALWFWDSIARLHPPAQWHAIPALLLTGKLSCLLGALLVFAPRSIFDPAHSTALDDQQLAGLLMLAACPASYVLAGILTTLRCVGLRLTPPRPAPDPP